MMNTAIDFTQELDLVDEKKTVLEKTKDLKIYTGDDYRKAKGFWAQIRMLRGKVKEAYQPLIDQAHRLHKDAIAKRDEFDKPLEAAEKTVKSALAEYDRIQDQRRREEETRLREEARRQEEERRLAQAAELEAMGRNDLADQILDVPINACAPPIPVPAREKGDPVFRTVWKYRITNPDLVPREYLIPDPVKIGGVVRALKDATNIPGVEAYAERV